jgi:hypothetical protein
MCCRHKIESQKDLLEDQLNDALTQGSAITDDSNVRYTTNIDL